jgi:hypothetical protein
MGPSHILTTPVSRVVAVLCFAVALGIGVWHARKDRGISSVLRLAAGCAGMAGVWCEAAGLTRMATLLLLPAGVVCLVADAIQFVVRRARRRGR